MQGKLAADDMQMDADDQERPDEANQEEQRDQQYDANQPDESDEENDDNI